MAERWSWRAAPVSERIACTVAGLLIGALILGVAAVLLGGLWHLVWLAWSW